MQEVLSEIGAWRERGDRIALATVIDVQRSAPRPPGAKMAVNEHGEIAGSVSGGCVEGAVAEIADGILRGDPPQLVHFGIADSDAWDVGLPCGGEIDVWVQAYEPSRFEELARSGGRAAEVTVLEGAVSRREAAGVRRRCATGSLGSPELDDEAARVATELLWAETSERRDGLFVDVIGPPPRLLVFGAVDIAASLCTLARAAGWRPYVIDPRARFATPDRFPDAEEVIAAWPEEAVAQLGGVDPATSIVVLTHDPKLDDAALMLALGSPARFIGAMGSRRAQAKRRERLLELGIGDDEFERISAPVGLDLGGISREETALSILAEIVAARHGRDGGPARREQGPDPRGARLICGLILAAGAGTRFGEQPKLLAELEGRPLLRARGRRAVQGCGTGADRGGAGRVRRGDPGAGRLHARRAGRVRALGGGAVALASARDRVSDRRPGGSQGDRHAGRSAADDLGADRALRRASRRRPVPSTTAARDIRWCSGPCR